MDINVIITAAALGAASIAGSLLGLVVRRIPHKCNDIFLGYCAGMMLAASIVCLISPAVAMAGTSSWWQAIIGVAAGVALIGLLDIIVPHLHHLTGIDTEAHKGNASVNRILLFVAAIAIHKLPEGMASGVVFEGGNIADAYAVAASIALQNIPEGLVVVTPLLMIGISAWRAAAAALAVALIEVAGVIIGNSLGSISGALMPMLLGLAGGTMLYVISDEMIPETHSHGYEKPATYALVAGVVTMLMIEHMFS